ncbi:hypothetical protein ACI2OX_03995 [Bacillus sp. N9]
MLSNAHLQHTETVTFTIAKGNKTDLSEELQAKIGDRPFVDFGFSTSEKQVDFKHPGAAIDFFLPYVRMDGELPSAWYIDANGKATPISASKYNEEIGGMTFTTPHSGRFAIFQK